MVKNKIFCRWIFSVSFLFWIDSANFNSSYYDESTQLLFCLSPPTINEVFVVVVQLKDEIVLIYCKKSLSQKSSKIEINTTHNRQGKRSFKFPQMVTKITRNQKLTHSDSIERLLITLFIINFYSQFLIIITFNFNSFYWISKNKFYFKFFSTHFYLLLIISHRNIFFLYFFIFLKQRIISHMSQKFYIVRCQFFILMHFDISRTRI